MPSAHTTQKSFKDTKRDKPKHSSKDKGVTKKGGAGGKGSWGSAKDDHKYMDEDGHALGQRDPNYDPVDATENAKQIRLSVYTPSEQVGRDFRTSMTDLVQFKQAVRAALEEYLVSHDVEEFITCIKEADSPLHHQDLPAILIKAAMDRPDQDRARISALLSALSKANTLSTTQMTQGFRKLYHNIEDMRNDHPDAKIILSDFVGHGIATGYLDGKDTAQMDQALTDLEKFPALKGTKAKIKSAVKEYFSSNELAEFTSAIKTINPALQFEAVKVLLSLALDLEDCHRERANVALASLAHSTISQEQVSKGVTILLDRVEDIFLDVPDVLRLFSCMIARAIADEALEPAFLLRLDLAPSDMGFSVAAQAKKLMNMDNAAAKLEDVWGASSAQERLAGC